MASIKLHVYRTEMGDNGTEGCDYRGKGELGAGENDQHRTVVEVDPAPEELCERVLITGSIANSLFRDLSKSQPDIFGKIASVLGLEGDGQVSLRFGVWDN